MKKIVSFAIILSAVFYLGFPTAKATDAFLDLAENHWAYGDILKLADLGVINGYPDGSFRPDGVVTRGEVAKMATELLKLPAGGPTSYDDLNPSRITDMQDDKPVYIGEKWYTPYA